jgi:mutator protein MutT
MNDDRKLSAWAIITNSNDKFLLLKRGAKSNNPNLWNFPGGTVDEGEEPLKSATRELYEEAGITTRNLVFKRVILQPNVKIFFYSRKITNPNIKVKINNESSKYGWFDLDEIKKLKLHKPTQFYINTL